MKVGKRLLCAAALLMAGQAWADTTWTLSSNSTYTYGWRADSGQNIIATADYFWTPSYGLGIQQSGESTDGNHGVDNYGANEMLLLYFPTKVALTSFTLGWAKEGNNNSYVNNQADMTVMALTDPSKAGAPTGSSTPKMGAPNPGLQWSQLTANGWKVIGHYADVKTNQAQTVDPMGYLSSYWLVGAYNNLVGVGGAACATCAEGWNTYDYAKVLSVAYTTTGGGPPVPEPGSLALLASAFVGLAGVSRRRKAL